MCVRHADYLNDEGKLKSLMNEVIKAIKKVIMVRLILSLLSFYLGCRIAKSITDVI